MCYEISCRRFLRDYLAAHSRARHVEIRALNNVIAQVRQNSPQMVVIDFTQPALSALINDAGSRNLVWVPGSLFFSDAFRAQLCAEEEEEMPDDLKEPYYNAIAAEQG